MNAHAPAYTLDSAELLLQLAAISRGLDATHPEYERLSRRELSEQLRAIIASVYMVACQDLSDVSALEGV